MNGEKGLLLLANIRGSEERMGVLNPYLASFFFSLKCHLTAFSLINVVDECLFTSCSLALGSQAKREPDAICYLLSDIDFLPFLFCCQEPNWERENLLSRQAIKLFCTFVLLGIPAFSTMANVMQDVCKGRKELDLLSK